MQLVITETAEGGVWVQLEGETAAEMEALEELAAQGVRTTARDLEAIPRLRQLAAPFGVPVQEVHRSA